MRVERTALDGVIEITPVRHSDERGWFSEIYNRAEWVQAGIDIDWVQDNESVSLAEGTVRGIHFQRQPMAQAKLVRVLAGRIFDVAVDLRCSSPNFGSHVAVELSAAAGNQLLVPVGFGHAFMTLEPDCHVSYKVSAPYSRDHDSGIAWNDPALEIAWPILADQAVASAKDLSAPSMAEAGHLLFD